MKLSNANCDESIICENEHPLAKGSLFPFLWQYSPSFVLWIHYFTWLKFKQLLRHLVLLNILPLQVRTIEAWSSAKEPERRKAERKYIPIFLTLLWTTGQHYCIEYSFMNCTWILLIHFGAKRSSQGSEIIPLKLFGFDPEQLFLE